MFQETLGADGFGVITGASSSASGPVDPSCTTICVVGLPPFMSDREFRFMFKFAYGFERASINRTKAGQSVGYARFTTKEEAQAAVDFLHGSSLDEELTHPVKAFMSSTQLSDDLLDKSKRGNNKRTYEMAGFDQQHQRQLQGGFGGFGGGFVGQLPGGFGGTPKIGRGISGIGRVGGRGRGRGRIGGRGAVHVF
eukprot:NODE_7535_length_767_cov_38.560559_g6923_i0.p1 GENE.NODE_7535_length_767_cov_38.560559_g6923_i0~~NODE_7535_length_767_cov_38.560559_g6923_i0.p1  ORF type:complete len:195 (-),score=33.48 NODE_7535_length_767_cov_38.560559_g6923_i0:125-709(-)